MKKKSSSRRRSGIHTWSVLVQTQGFEVERFYWSAVARNGKIVADNYTVSASGRNRGAKKASIRYGLEIIRHGRLKSSPLK